MTPSESGPSKLSEPKMRNGIQCGALARYTGKTALSAPDAVKAEIRSLITITASCEFGATS